MKRSLSTSEVEAMFAKASTPPAPASRAIAASRATEAAFPITIDPDDHQYRGVGAPAYRDLYAGALWKAQELSAQLYRTNPLANRIIRIYTTFMAGEGFTIDCDNPEVQGVCEEFWTSERNRWDRNHRNHAKNYLLFGEGFHPVKADELGNSTVGFIDPIAVDWVERSALNNMLLDTVVMRSDPGDRLRLKVVKSEDDPFEDGAGLMKGDTFAWLYDRIGAASRGTPFLLPTLDWLDAYDQTLWELLERIKALRAFFWDVEVDGGQTEIDAAKLAWGTAPPRSGSVRFRTPAIRPNALTPQLNNSDDVAAARHIIRHIATGSGLAPHWLGDPEDANRSTAETMDKPVFRALTDTQAEWKQNVEDVLRFVVDAKVRAGVLGRILPRHDEEDEVTDDQMPARDLVEVIVPQISDDDVLTAAQALASTASALMQLDTMGALGPQAIRKVVRQLLPALGVPADELPDPEDDVEDDEEVSIQTIDRLAKAGAKANAEERFTEARR